ncbi:MAG TPA: hypothetical protein VGN85_05910, partial [Methyloceanibacter sp.]|nr:hypothetical protein [Methyloceanibacter sp.]
MVKHFAWRNKVVNLALGAGHEVGSADPGFLRATGQPRAEGVMMSLRNAALAKPKRQIDAELSSLRDRLIETRAFSTAL